MLIANQELRDLLSRYAGSSKDEQLSIKEGRRLRALAKNTPLASLFRWVDEKLAQSADAFATSSPPALRRFLKAIAQPSPIIGLILSPATTVPELRKILANKIFPREAPATLGLLQTNCPCLYELLKSELCSNLLTFPLEITPVLKWIVDRCDDVTARKESQLQAQSSVSHCVRAPRG